MYFHKTFSLCCIALALGVPTALRAATRAVALPAEQSDSRQALGALKLLFSAYAAGNRLQMEYLIVPEMIGYARVLDAVQEDMLMSKQMRVTFSDTRTQVSEDIAVIQTRWEKRFIQLPAALAVRKSGSATFTLKRIGSAWKLSAMSGDNPFASE